MSKTRKALLVVLCLAGVLFATHLWSQREPRYAGHSLSYWLARLPEYSEDGPTPEKQAPNEAISRIGTNAVPFLLKSIQSLRNDPNPKAFSYLPRKIAQPLRDRIVSGLQYERQKAQVAAKAFSALGEKATPWIPALSNLVTVGKNRHVRSVSSIALASIGTAALQPIIGLIENPATRERTEVVASLYYIPGWRTNGAIHKVLLGCLRDSDPNIRVHAVAMLRSCEGRPESIIPAFMAALDDSSDSRLTAALIRSLASFGTNARPALALIARCTNSPSERIRRGATNALYEIAPEIFPLAPRQTNELEKQVMRWRYRAGVITNPPAARTSAVQKE